MSLHVADDPARALAERFVAELPRDGRVHVALSGGSTPRQLFRLLATEFRGAVPWERVEIWQVDERCAPPDHADSNWRLIAAELLARGNGIVAHRIEVERDTAAEAYERLLRDRVPEGPDGRPALDFVFLGMGADGHTASLFPNSAALDEAARLVVFNEVPQRAVRRVTMTFPLLRAARRRWFLVAGADKAAALARVQRGELPAGQLADAEWFLDPAAAGESRP
ncbi:MAG TPA: 6-phosphogluconolactonase [Candidatus Hydrogenedentes bacterium]|nr:6-phosphogluconolactonase [Candidatus Hydrogenedentota bacterium]